MQNYRSMDRAALKREFEALQAAYADAKSKNLKLNMARGKPSAQQLDLISDLLSVLTTPKDCFSDGIDARNYGDLSGLPCAKAYWADVLGCKAAETFVGGSSSLSLMYDLISKAYTHGLFTSERPWCREEKVKFLCPAPGYDRHFRITESFGAELIAVPMKEDGPDMDLVEALVKDAAVKGIWCVPKFSNPQGITYSDETIRRIAALKPAAPDFAVMWDNAYCVHEFSGEFEPFADIISLCREAGNPHMVWEFASTSKITFPGSGISVMASSEENIRYMSKLMSVQMISYDKVNQLRHVKYLKNRTHTLEIMQRHASVLAPKFRTVLEILQRELSGLGVASWTSPMGGYFISLDAMPGTAKRIWQLCRDAGVVLTEAGATYPYGVDPMDRNLRIAPSLPPLEELRQAMEVFCICVRLAACEKLLATE